MKIFFIILGVVAIISLLVIFLFLFRVGKPVNEALSKSYYHHYWKDKIIYSPMGNWFELGYAELDTDPAQFVVIAEHFAKDNTTVFWNDKRLQQVDLATFWVDKGGIPKDARHVYYDKQYEPTLVVVEGADPKSYHRMNRLDDQYLDLEWSKDDFNYFFNGMKVSVDYKTFTRINETLAIDTNFIYTMSYEEGLVKRVENPGGVVGKLTNQYARIGNSIAHSNWKNKFSLLPFKQIGDIRVVNDRNLIVNETLINEGRLIPTLDVATLEILDYEFIRDKQSVYFDGDKIEGSDPQSFSIIFEFYSKDNKHVYYKTTPLSGADPATIRYDTPNGILTDGTRSYRDGELITKSN